ncbi:MAG: hypothetical protein D6806_07950 [Deltaproteobacteria bacterium]|nr:MAG: hypothetical protein D6806_07950 [Deltaproteobacteria bacterium]
MNAGSFIDTRVIVLLAVGVVLLLLAKRLSSGRLEGESATGLERLLWILGMLITASTLIYALSQGCIGALDRTKKKAEEKKSLVRYEQEPSGCGAGSKARRLKKFKSDGAR